jgi:hypothetical protein
VRVTYGADGRLWLQYWLFYYFNSLPPVHEGDWEMVQLGLNNAILAPELAAYSQHTAGQQCNWASVEKTGLQPNVYVGRDSHASYFHAIPLVADGAKSPSVSPTADEISDNKPSCAGWIGKWGESNTSPAGPARGGNADKRDPGLWAKGLGPCD